MDSTIPFATIGPNPAGISGAASAADEGVIKMKLNNMANMIELKNILIDCISLPLFLPLI